MALPRLRAETIERLETTPKRIRARLDGQLVADSMRARIVRPQQGPPRTYAFPEEDLLLPVPDDGRIEVDGHVALQWEDMDHWYEEDEEVFIHPRDPHKRIDVLASSRHVVIELDGTTLAESRRPTMLFEHGDGLPERYYLPHEDVRLDLLRPSDTTTGCPYKGWSDYYHVQTDRGTHEDLVWTYRSPLREVEPIRGLLCFFNEKVDMTVDGRRVDRPTSPFS